MPLNNFELQLLKEFEDRYKKNNSTNKITNNFNYKNSKQSKVINNDSNIKDSNFTKTINANLKTNELFKKYKIDYKLDLHGFSLNDAYKKLYNLFELSFNNNYRFLLIITGKGLHSNSNSKTIKESIIDWFNTPFFSNKIIKYEYPPIKYGGSGALYVLLKKNKMKLD